MLPLGLRALRGTESVSLKLQNCLCLISFAQLLNVTEEWISSYWVLQQKSCLHYWGNRFYGKGRKIPILYKKNFTCASLGSPGETIKMHKCYKSLIRSKKDLDTDMRLKELLSSVLFDRFEHFKTNNQML